MNTIPVPKSLIQQYFWWQHYDPVAMQKSLTNQQLARRIIFMRIIMAITVPVIVLMILFYSDSEVLRIFANHTFKLFILLVTLSGFAFILTQSAFFNLIYLFSPPLLLGIIAIAGFAALNPYAVTPALSLLAFIATVCTTDLFRVWQYKVGALHEKENRICFRALHPALIGAWHKAYRIRIIITIGMSIIAIIGLISGSAYAWVFTAITLGMIRIDAILWALLYPPALQPTRKDARSGYALRHALWLPAPLLNQSLEQFSGRFMDWAPSHIATQAADQPPTYHQHSLALWLFEMAHDSHLTMALLKRLRQRQQLLAICIPLSTLPGSLALLRQAAHIATTDEKPRILALIALTQEAEKPIEQQFWIRHCEQSVAKLTELQAIFQAVVTTLKHPVQSATPSHSLSLTALHGIDVTDIATLTNKLALLIPSLITNVTPCHPPNATSFDTRYNHHSWPLALAKHLTKPSCLTT